MLPRTPSFRLDGKRALITGASSGIGLGCAVALAEAGAHTILIARREDPLLDLHKAFHAEGWSSEVKSLDISDIEASESYISGIEPVDILVNSAGLARHTPAVATMPDDYDTVMDLNLRAAYFVTRAVARQLIKAGKPGSLINISSQMGHVGGIDRAVYCATKFGMEGFTKAMAIEFGPHKIRVNTICPTFVRTPLAEQTLADPAKREWVESKIKLGNVAEIEDIMGAATFLASDASAMITGTSLLIDGGWTAD